MEFQCGHCQGRLALDSARAVARRDECPHCGHDLHSCRNCRFYDQQAYNQCLETQAERVLDKQNANFCDYFEYQSGPRSGGNVPDAAQRLRQLDELFKK